MTYVNFFIPLKQTNAPTKMNSSIYKYLIIKSLDLIIQFHQNDLTFEGLKKLKQTIINDPQYNPNFNFIIDLRLSEIKMSRDELRLFGDWVEVLLNDKRKQMALLTANPQQVTQAMLFKINDNIKHLSYDVFCTMEAALAHVGVDISNMQFIENEIDKLKVKN